MDKPGVLVIIAPIAGSPAEKAGIKAGDIVTKIDDLDVTDKISLQDAVNKIK
jgi:carboxyl-terminal processing protease